MKSLLLFVVFSGFSLASAFAAEKPNILWIFSEDLSPYMGCYDDPINAGHTPAIDKLAAEGVLFTRAYSPAPVCSAARSAIITGKMQTTTGVHQHRSGRTTNGVVPEDTRILLPDGITTIPELMREAGYFTFNCGKDDYNFHYDRRALYTVGTKEEYVAGENGWQGNTSADYKDWGTNTWDAREDESQPWFGQIMIWGGKANSKHVREGHLLGDEEVPVPPYFPDTSEQRKAWTQHYNAARGADHQIEEILAKLEADGQLENTIVFFFSDHGNNQSLRHKQFCYEGGVHVPLMVAGDHPAIGSGVVRDELVSLLDVSATTLSLGAAAMPEYLDGRDLFAADHEPREVVFGARDRCDYTIDRIRTVRSDRFRYIRNFYPDRPLLQAQYRDGRGPSKDLHDRHDAGELNEYQEEHWFGVRPKEELYELATDPWEINNLAGDPAFAEELAKHRGILDSWVEETDDKGQYPEDTIQLKATYDLWKDKPVFRDADTNPEYDQFR